MSTHESKGGFKMITKVFFLSLLADIIKQKQITISVSDNITVKDLLESIKYKFGEALKDTIFNPMGDLNKYIIILLNGKDIRLMNGLNTIINNNDEISLLPAIAGG